MFLCSAEDEDVTQPRSSDAAGRNNFTHFVQHAREEVTPVFETLQQRAMKHSRVQSDTQLVHDQSDLDDGKIQDETEQKKR